MRSSLLEKYRTSPRPSPPRSKCRRAARTSIAATRALEPGKSTIRFEFDYDGGVLGKPGKGTIHVNDEKVAEGHVERTQPMVFSADETADVGVDLGTPVVDPIGFERRSRFTGRIPTLTIKIR